ncbi:MAG: hypothetical protein ACK47B_23600 [Armatimonadota bacterium]
MSMCTVTQSPPAPQPSDLQRVILRQAVILRELLPPLGNAVARAVREKFVQYWQEEICRRGRLAHRLEEQRAAYLAAVLSQAKDSFWLARAYLDPVTDDWLADVRECLSCRGKVEDSRVATRTCQACALAFLSAAPRSPEPQRNRRGEVIAIRQFGSVR